MITILFPALVAALGAFIYVISDKPKLSEIGRLAFFVGLFWGVYLLVGKTFHFG